MLISAQILHFLMTFSAVAADAAKPAAIGLDQSIVDSTVKKNLSKVRDCYNNNTKDLSPKPSGIVTTRFVVGSDGKVVSVDIVGSDLNNAKVETCLSNELKTIAFPAPGGGGTVRVDYPFRFVPTLGKNK
jgi:hypothetical protein